MPFSPDSDANYQKYLTTKATLNAEHAAEYTDQMIQYLCQQATATGTINSAMITSADTAAKVATKAKKHTF